MPAGAKYMLRNELIELISMTEYRGGVLQESLKQRRGIGAYFMGVLPFSRTTHPNTTLMVAGVMRVAQFLAIYYKNALSRVRPTQLAPAIMPPIANPGHASCPSAHSTEAYMVAMALSTIQHVHGMRTSHLVENPQNPAVPADTVTRDPMIDMARRIARNREVLGVHYPSDSEAGLGSDYTVTMP